LARLYRAQSNADRHNGITAESSESSLCLNRNFRFNTFASDWQRSRTL
jgi:hypothetical protein